MRTADELVVVCCQLGDRTAFEALVARWHRPVWTFVRGMLRGDERCDDLVQEVWVRVVRGLPRLQEPARFPAWLFTVARRVVTDELRVTYRQPERDDDADLEAEPEAGAPDDVRRLLDRLDLDAALSALEAGDREAVVLFHLLDLPLTEVAEVLEVPPGTVKSRLHRARQQLRRHLDDPEIPR